MSGFIDMQTWKRKNHYQMFSKMDYSFFNICAPLDISDFYKYIKQNNEPFFISFLYLVTKAANNIEEFLYRIRTDGIYSLDECHPSYTVMGKNDLFAFCYSDYSTDYVKFKANAVLDIQKASSSEMFNEGNNRDDYIYITSIPWVSFTSISHPISINKNDSIPRISWGRYEEKEGKLSIPLSVSLHHGLADGLHAGRYFQLLQEYLNNPEDHFK